MNEFTFFDGQRVAIDIPGVLTGTGVILGAATTPYPIMGRMWIVGFDVDVRTHDGDWFPNATYPYQCASIPECHIKPLI